jgi:SagB-type dehydrogenase family enzyme
MNRFVAVWLEIAALGIGAAGCSDAAPEPSASTPTRPPVEASSGSDLPAPRTGGATSLEEALAQRRSVRDFTNEPLETDQLSQLLWAAQGVTAEWGGRTAPSAGALYPLEIYVATAEFLARYVPADHRLEALGNTDVRSELADAALGQEPVADAPAVFVITAVPARTEVKYGARATRYVQLEAGHACQNLLLEAVALGLGAVPIGAFDDDGVRSVLGLPGDEQPLYVVPVGYPAV